jgi:alanine-synthesizing transaminase
VLEGIARLAERNKLIVFSDEIYDRILYDEAVHVPLAKLVNDTLCITMGGLSKKLPGSRF